MHKNIWHKKAIILSCLFGIYIIEPSASTVFINCQKLRTLSILNLQQQGAHSSTQLAL